MSTTFNCEIFYQCTTYNNSHNISVSAHDIFYIATWPFCLTVCQSVTDMDELEFIYSLRDQFPRMRDKSLHKS